MRGIGVAMGGVLLAATFYVAPAAAQSGCGIQQAADLAVQRQIALLDAAKVDSSEFFNGANSCLGSNLLTSFDLSNLIPSNFDFLGNIGSSLIDRVIQQATQQVCQVLNGKIQEVVGNINGQMADFNSLIGGQMADLLGGSSSSISPITIPSLPNIGQYDFTTASASSSQAPTSPIVTPPSGNAGGNLTQQSTFTSTDSSSTTTSGGLFEDMFAR